MPRILLLATLMVLIAGLLAPRPRPHRDFRPDLASPAREDEVLVQLRPAGISLSDEVLSRRLGGLVVDQIDDLDVVRLRLKGTETVAQAVERIGSLPLVESVEPNHLVKASVAPNDPYYTAQAGYLDLIHAAAAWEIERGDASVLVAVLDSGIDLDHIDLEGKIWTNPIEVAGNGIDEDGNGCPDDLHGCNLVAPGTTDKSCSIPGPTVVKDDNGHGTFVSGIIASVGNNGLGISGAAPGVTILPVKILDCLGGGTAADAARGILYAAHSGARVANISFGADGESQTLANAMHEAYSRYNMVIIAATGNEGTNRVSFPARLPEAFAVGSSGTPTDPAARSVFSDWGPEVSFVAPGQNIISTLPGEFCGKGWTCVEDGPYAIASGTSFAAPLASALAALIVSRHPNLSPEAVRKIMASTAKNLPDGTTARWDGAGRIDMQEALKQQRYYLGATGVARN